VDNPVDNLWIRVGVTSVISSRGDRPAPTSEAILTFGFILKRGISLEYKGVIVILVPRVTLLVQLCISSVN
jgi:hypothetical protein